MKNRNPGKRFSTDGLMLNLAKALIQDFRNVAGDPLLFRNHLESLYQGDIAKIRATVPALDFDCDEPYLFKMAYQIQSLFKRYRFEKDLYTDDELVNSSIQKFMDVQNHIANHDLSLVSEFTNKVLDYAAMFIRLCLGEYDDEEHRYLCRFGKRASVGVPARMACEAARWELPISGSHEQIAWFDSEMSQDLAVQEYWARQRERDPNRSTYQVTSSLKLTLVPKSFKSLRAIMPNTTIGSYMSYGLGEMIRKRLKVAGYDISRLQERHRDLACRASTHRAYTTADLSSASDTISVQLIQRLLPADWFDILNRSRIGVVELPNGELVSSETFCTMGIGFTFPLQTLVFLSILKALHFLLYGKLRSTISVYGDDMIYPSFMHSFVAEQFAEIGFILNVDKTFSSGPFRESCGGDYLCGVDVRPFQPRNDQVRVGQLAYEAMLYKCINNLLRRWSEHEVSGTLHYLLSEVVRCSGTIRRVPGDYPDDSGVRCPTIAYWDFLSQYPLAAVKSVGHGLYRFSYLRFVAETKEERRHEPYYWLALRERESHQSYNHSDYRSRAIRPSALQQLINQTVGESRTPSLIWKEHPKLTYRSCLTGRRLRRMLSYVALSHTGRYKRQSGTSGFEDRRHRT